MKKKSNKKSLDKSPNTAKPINPYWVLLVAIILPGVGHLMLRETERAVMFGFFTMLLGAITFQLTTPDHSFLGRYAGGLFIYALSITDAYRLARIRYENAAHLAAR